MAALASAACSSGDGSAVGEVRADDLTGGGPMVPADRFVAEATAVGRDLVLPEGYDLRVDLITPTAIPESTLRSALAFRAVCTWAHHGMARADNASMRTASADTIGTTIDGTDLEEPAADHLESTHIVSAVRAGDAVAIDLFLDGNCRGQGLEGYE